MSVRVRLASSERELSASIALRTEVFVREQGVAPEDELDGRDEQALHLIAVDERDQVIGTCRLLPDGERIKLGRMAVVRSRRGEGIAALLLAEADRQAAARGATRISLGAQLPALGVYERAGYTARGEVFLDAGLEHIWMDKQIA